MSSRWSRSRICCWRRKDDERRRTKDRDVFKQHFPKGQHRASRTSGVGPFVCEAEWLTMACMTSAGSQTPRPHARDLGIRPGVLPTGPLNAITDVAGVRVGHVTLREGDDLRTGVTAILPHAGNLFQEKVPAGLAVGNGFGKLTGATQLIELGELETPIVLTNTLAVPRAADALIDWTLAQPGNEAVVSVNPVVGETNDSTLNDIRRRAVTVDHVLAAIKAARGGSVARGVRRRGDGDGRVRVEGRHRHQLATPARRIGRLHRRRPGAIELRRRAANHGHPGRRTTGTLLPEGSAPSEARSPQRR